MGLRIVLCAILGMESDILSPYVDVEGDDGRTQPRSSISGHHNSLASSRSFAERTTYFGIVAAMLIAQLRQGRTSSKYGVAMIEKATLWMGSGLDDNSK
jgi:hypothetical protein